MPASGPNRAYTRLESRGWPWVAPTPIRCAVRPEFGPARTVPGRGARTQCQLPFVGPKHGR